MASGPITSWQLDGETMETLFSRTPKSLQMVTAAMKLKDACSLEKQLWQTLTAFKKARDTTLPTKVHLVKAVVFPVVLYGCESWAIKKAEHQRIYAFELWCWKDSWESLGLQGDQTSKSYRKPILNVHWRDWSWSWNSNTLATWCKELTHWKRPWCRERLKVGGEGEDRGWDGWMASLTQWKWVWASSGR